MNQFGMKKAYQHYAHAFLRHYNLQEGKDIPDHKIPEALKTSNKQAAEALSKLKLAEEALDFVRRDMELRTKLRDIWQMQCEQSEAELMQCIDVLKKHAMELGIVLDK